jgi:3-polyprenyl-4-hydroxybenzoate decarboxylase
VKDYDNYESFFRAHGDSEVMLSIDKKYRRPITVNELFEHFRDKIFNELGIDEHEILGTTSTN